MPQNIDDFNSGVALILGKLYEHFPKSIQLSANELPTIDFQAGGPPGEERIDRYIELYEIYFHTACFLLAEGYISGKRVESYTVIYDCTLTTKGLAALQRVPNSIQGKKRSVGDFLIDLSKDGLKTVTKEAVSVAVRSILNG